MLTHENVVFKLEAMGITYQVISAQSFSAWMKSTVTSGSACDKCKNGKKLVPMKPLNTIVQYCQQEKVVIETKDQQTQDATGANVIEKKKPFLLYSSKPTQTSFMQGKYQKNFSKASLIFATT